MVVNKMVWVGSVVFASAMLVVIGGINVVEGLVALGQRGRVVVVEDKFYLVDLTGWGWGLLISGGVLILTGLGLLAAKSAARVAAIVIVGVHAVAQVFWIGAYPIWSLLMIALDTVVLYALTVRWTDVREETTGVSAIGEHSRVS
ncbi:hypothetical protein [Kutzneria sp. 744]|uniref:DUF7144 family membrane protein n=1 Tax=Kutzneria sp. (strain 744) TaxID=345341 RepID=UPI0004ACDF01|nr:hypothetical protein [Kutzneria sp. 744]